MNPKSENRTFWIFPGTIHIQATYGLSYRPSLINSILDLFSTSIQAVGTSQPTVHPNNYYDDDRQHHVLDVALGQMENNLDKLKGNRGPNQGTGTSLSINGQTVYHSTTTYHKNGMCTIFYTFDRTSSLIEIHAIGGHMDSYYYLDCASEVFHQQAYALRGKEWGYYADKSFTANGILIL